ncbi:DNA topoisomerase III [Pisciglobus halotolerans]|uniref:DNA topoisomerase 3 n=1 Tax=Pisciglobus halotolerans TaxID=745365 RepID=A0A1I3BM48_9LACT|nr:DNA topoisomerase III [Pisciglobus halotolerans]SFH63240.1 DNA topoisomerase-3 [Pisciglobus halotolerans]
MGKSLVLAEKPSVARDIAHVLNCSKKGNGFLEGSHYIVTWALGHLVTLADPEVYDQKYKTWKLEDLPMLPGDLKLTVIKKTGKQFQQIKTQLHRKDVKEVIIATDAGREGELVARWILEKAKTHLPIKRLWISSVTDKAIKEGFKQLKPGKQYEDLYASAVARSEADWYVGLNATRALTTKFNAQLNAGRVQTPVVAIIAKREEEIKAFKPKIYYGIEAKTEHGLTFTWQDAKTKQHRLFDQQQAKQIIRSAQGNQAEIVAVERKEKKHYAPGLYDLTELQREAHKRFGFSAKETLNVMQKLYEQHKVLTYPRTDSRYLSTDIVSTLAERVKACAFGEFRAFGKNITSKPIKGKPSFVDNSKVSDHHAIIPTEQAANLSKLSHKERQIYQMVVQRFLAVLLPAYEYEQVLLQAQINQANFIAKGRNDKHLGWKEVYHTETFNDEEESTKEQSLPELAKGDILTVKKVAETTGQTKPPAYFNEATLLSAMEDPVHYMDNQNKRLQQTLKATGGLGTVATRADIIDKLFRSFLIEKQGQDIHATSKGKQLLELVPEDLRSPELTADWEQKLERIAKGTLQKEAFIKETKTYTKKVVSEIKMSAATYKHENLSTKHCPECGKPMLEVNGKKGKMLICQDRDCGYRRSVSRLTNARCPECKKKMELHGEGAGQIFVCKCGYREKLSAFKKRQQKKGTGKADKRTVSQYMKRQEKEEPLNTALADALKGLKLDND